MKVLDIFKSQKKRQQTAEVVQEQQAEKDLQALFGSSFQLKNLCSLLQMEDHLELVKLCRDLQIGKIAVNTNSDVKASVLLHHANVGLKRLPDSRIEEQEFSRQKQNLSNITDYIAKHGVFWKRCYLNDKNALGWTKRLCQSERRFYSALALDVLQIAMRTGRIKDVNKLWDIAQKSCFENHDRLQKLGITEIGWNRSPQAKATQNESSR